MLLQTPRLKLRPVSETDTITVHALHSLPEVDEFNTMGIPENIDVTRDLVSGWRKSWEEEPKKKYVFCITGDADVFIGLIGINMGKPTYRNAEIWFKLHPMHWNKGYASEAVNAILHFCFKELKLHRVEAGCATANVASKRVLEKAGMKQEAHRRKLLPIRGEWKDNYEFAILEDDYMND
jgi:ribosomal-protein-alanine N-acetyltransferase